MGTGFLIFVAVAGLMSAAPGNVNFDSSKPGAAPPNWTIGPGSHGTLPWLVRSDSSAPSRGNVLESSARGDDSPVAVFDPVICKDGDLSVKFRIDPKASGGTAGIVWRYADARNYYVLDFNPGQKTITLYRVRDGVRQPVPEKGLGLLRSRHDIPTGQWHAAKVSFRGNNIKVFFGNRRLFEASDSGLAGAGKAGVVTSGATIAAFDDFRIDKKS